MVEGVGRDIVQRTKRLMKDEDTREFLKSGQVAYVATVCEDGWPYVIPLVYVYEGGPVLYLHIGSIKQSLFRENVKANPRICLSIADKGNLNPGREFACQSALEYSSVVAYGTLKEIPDDEKKSWFYDKLLEKYGDPSWNFKPGYYPFINKTVVYEMDIEILTGKANEGITH